MDDIQRIVIDKLSGRYGMSGSYFLVCKSWYKHIRQTSFQYNCKHSQHLYKQLMDQQRIYMEWLDLRRQTLYDEILVRYNEKLCRFEKDMRVVLQQSTHNVNQLMTMRQSWYDVPGFGTYDGFWSSFTVALEGRSMSSISLDDKWQYLASWVQYRKDSFKHHNWFTTDVVNYVLEDKARRIQRAWKRYRSVKRMSCQMKIWEFYHKKALRWNVRL